jgi:hypothetical protein
MARSARISFPTSEYQFLSLSLLQEDSLALFNGLKENEFLGRSLGQFISVASPHVRKIPQCFSTRKIGKVNTVAFLPTAGIFRTLEGVYLLENKWSRREDLNLRPPGPEPDANPY